MKPLLFLLLTAALFTGCASHQIHSTPEGAKIHYKGSLTYKPWIAQRTPIKVRKGIEWPYGYHYARVTWDDGEVSDWKLIDKDLHFLKQKSGEASTVQLNTDNLSTSSSAAPPINLPSTQNH